MAETKKPTTRKESCESIRYFNLKPIEKFDGLKFPTNGEILQRYFYIKDQSCHTEKPKNIAVKIYHKIENIYSKAPFSMKKKSFCLDKICILYKEWQILNGQRKSSKNRTENIQKELKNTWNLVGIKCYS